jgi:dienelactone hydrolase
MSAPPPLAPLEMTIRAGDGLLLKGVLAYPEHAAGRLCPLAVLAHQYPATADSFAPLIEDLLDLGVAALAFDERGHGSSITGVTGTVVIDTPVGFTADDFGRAFMASAERVAFGRIDDDIVRVASWGAVQNYIDRSRLLLVGASVGGSGAVLAAPRIAGLAGLLTFGPAGAPAFPDGPARCRQAATGLKAPALHTSSEDDPFAAAANSREWSQGPLAGHRIIPGAAHAMAIYYEVREDVLQFIRHALAR